MSQAEDPGSQGERTALAWSRTLLAAAALVAFVAVSAERVGSPRGVVILLGVVAVLLFLATSVVPRRVWVRSREALDGTAAAARPVPTLVLSLCVAVVAVIALIISMGGGPR